MPQFYSLYIIYGNQFGFVDLESLEKLMQNHLCDKIVVFLEVKPHKNVENALQKYPLIEIKISKKPKKDAKKYKKNYDSEYSEKSSVLYALEVVADRSMWLDVC